MRSKYRSFLQSSGNVIKGSDDILVSGEEPLPRPERIQPERAMGMTPTSRAKYAGWLTAGLVLAAGIAGCRIHVDKGANGEDKTVQVDTPFGGVHVNTDKVSAADLGLPQYPGANPVTGDDHHKSADVHMGFGEWQLRVRVVSYETGDSQDKVAEFYKKALARYGDVLTCQDNAPIGTPTTTAEGLTCADNGKNGHVQWNNNDFNDSRLQLKAGSKRHQHIVGFEQPGNGRTRFALVALDLPAGVDGNSEHSD